MELTEKTLRTLRPSEGHVLTQAGEVSGKTRCFSELVYLGKGDTPDGWREITLAEAEEMQRVIREEEENRQRAEERERRRRELEAELAALDAGEGSPDE